MNFEQEYQKCLDKLVWATNHLQVEVSQTKLEQIAELIVQPMTGPWRYFHTPDHIFEVGGSTDPIEVLAALFHDLVYVQVDQSVNFNLAYYISGLIKEVKPLRGGGKEHLKIRDRAEIPEDDIFDIVISVFGFVSGQQLSPFAGQNEFLSALVAAKALQEFVAKKILVQICACIEATIPFQMPSPDGLTASDRLYKRIQETNNKFNLQFTEEEMVNSVKRAVRMANRDVEGFATPSAASFLDNTWNLLPETNHNLINSSTYTVQEYRVSLQKMEGFMNFLKPESVFRQFAGEPDEETYQNFVNGSRKNIEVARLYLGAKVVTIAFIEAISLRVGLDIPLSTMMGELPEKGTTSAKKLEDFLPNLDEQAYHPKNELETTVLNLLEKGRTKSSAYDIKHSPLATFFVKTMGFDELNHQLSHAKEFFKQLDSAGDLPAKISAAKVFITGFNSTVTDEVTDGILKVFDSRREALSRS
jgi:hypothetical protein